MEENLPPGFRFHPTDEELITYYLTHKVSDINFTARAIAEVDLNKCEPWDLPGKAKMGEKEWYFFNLRDRKYPTGFRTNRATDAGYWKTTGKDKEIFNSGVLVGMKKTLVFYRGRAPKGEKTNWVMHEYRLQTKFIYKSAKEQWVVCRIFQKSSGGKRQSSNPSPSFPTFLESPCNNTIASEPGEIGSLESDCFSNPNPNPNPNFSDLNRLVRSDFNFNNINNINNNSNLVNMNITWPSLSLPASLLNLNFPYPNPNIMKALELNMKNSFQPQEASNNGLNSLVAPGDFYSGINFNTNFIAAAAATAGGSSPKLLNTSRQTPLDLWCELGDYDVNTSTHENPSICNL